jgi:ABC-type Fe3+/spermidine/putrescine transport system ATPase subunit
MPPYLVLDRLDKSFAGNAVLSQLSLGIGKGEILALLGPSGSGKTTALRLIAGFEAPDRGSIQVEGQEVTRLPPERRNFGMVFQHYALFPHLSVGENVAFGLSSIPRLERAQRVAEMLGLVDLADFEARRVGEISGGQQQRVALARALAPRPRVLLLDEPLSNLDPTLREKTRGELKRTVQRIGITTVLVTHEQEEAFHLGDRVAVLEGGNLHQVGTPDELYGRPATRFVATFVGRASTLAGVVETDGRVRIKPGVSWTAESAQTVEPGEPVDVVVRPEALAFGEGMQGRVMERRFAGPVAYFQVALDGGGEIEVLAEPAAAAVGDVVHVGLDPKGLPPRAFPLTPRALTPSPSPDLPSEGDDKNPLQASPFSRSGGGRREKGPGDEVGGGGT